jgi:hypothetical protein
MNDVTICAKLACVEIYDKNTGAFNRITKVDDTVCGVVATGEKYYVVLQGTHDLKGVMEDVDIFQTQHNDLGLLHSGFNRDLSELIVKLMPKLPLDKPIVISGHSKGAAQGAILAARLHLMSIPIEKVVLFGCPNAGDRTFSNYLNQNIEGVSYRNAVNKFPYFGDPVPIVPISFVPPYEHRIITQKPKGLACLMPSSWHHASLYARQFS